MSAEQYAKDTAHCLSPTGKRRDLPRLYSPKIVEKILKLVINGESINKICARKGMPNKTNFGIWLRKYPEFATQYLEAKQIQSYFNVDDIRDIAEDCDETSGPAVAKAKLRCDVLKWEASKMMPKIYGDKASLDIVQSEVLEPGRMEEIVGTVMQKIAQQSKGLIEND